MAMDGYRFENDDTVVFVNGKKIDDAVIRSNFLYFGREYANF